MTERVRVAVLGSTGSIGLQALDVARLHSDRVEIVALSANSSGEVLLQQAREFGVRHLALGDESAAVAARGMVISGDPFDTVPGGPEAVASLAERDDVDIVLNALVGAAGLEVTVRALRAGRTLALANKESLVVGGELVMRLARPGSIVPVDSEHSAIFQCLLGEDPDDLARIWLTASGGPFFGASRSELADVKADRASAHPTWKMGPKITIDSSTLMNKGLEVIEAHHLFGVGYDDITVVVQRQSRVHSMVEFADGSVKAHLGVADMRVPIQYAFSYPRRWAAPAPPVDFRDDEAVTFDAPDLETFGCLRLAFEAGRAGGTAPVVLNAANEVAVAEFLSGRCGFLDIERVVERVLGDHPHEALTGFDQIAEVDDRARRAARSILSQ